MRPKNTLFDGGYGPVASLIHIFSNTTKANVLLTMEKLFSAYIWFQKDGVLYQTVWETMTQLRNDWQHRSCDFKLLDIFLEDMLTFVFIETSPPMVDAQEAKCEEIIRDVVVGR